MKKTLFTGILLCIINITATAQLRYFEFRVPYDSTFTSFIVATSDSVVIDEVLNDLTLPINNRRFISGGITNGHGGFNYDGTNWHSWHFIPNQWQLTAAAIEFCDGITALIGTHPAIIAGGQLQFCPWSSYPYQEVTAPVLGIESNDYIKDIKIYPNPATSTIFVDWVDLSSDALIKIEIYNPIGQLVLETSLTQNNNQIDISHLSNNVYFMNIIGRGKRLAIEKIIIN
ncbi:hypothetical protein NBRC110019_32530 [Neptunitalea chrysea]|uniref:Secretion system C-terminal sorting domain-containing protein n=1 Tax=Neptunitalea chrysea TaxID=1647581 RepID=A0A9W6B7B6_9FLAO|nr:T9SS type A sorting domain-containing protein [Neptunitalea chrysea]GLB54211.1 hypothetical protein NBRC110019_32530 [Neptunitalea chrysea]